MRWWSVAALLAMLGMARPAFADVAPVRIDASGAAGCIDEAAFASRVSSRGVTVASDAKDVAEIRTRAVGDETEGTLVLTRNVGVTTRVVKASSCDEVAAALAFTLGLALEAPPDEPPREEPKPPEPKPPPPPAEETPKPREARANEPASPPYALELGASAFGGIATGPAPELAVSAGVSLLAGLRREGSVFAPAIILSPMLIFPVSAADRVTVAFQGAATDLCPIRVGTAGFGLRPCTRVVLGQAQVRSAGFVGARLEERFYAAIGPSLDAELAIAGPLVLRGAIGAIFPLSRETYFVGDSAVFTVPIATVSAVAGVGVHFP